MKFKVLTKFHPKGLNTKRKIMTKEFKNLFDLLISSNPDNVYLAFALAQNFKEEFEKYVKYSLEDYEELYRFLQPKAPLKGLLTGIKEVSFYISQKKTTYLPKSIKILKRVKRVDLISQEIKELPAEIGEMNNLQELILDNNPFKKFPKEIEKLEKLETIWLVDTNLESFPQELANIKNLKYLSFSGNDINRFEDEIKELKEKKPLLKVENDDVDY